ncbi:hypothetical protein PCANC_03717 [Puccinia coronata f. sp. avenae]|uniref:Uncharacterized protein n=1 Tax=Puccinia coronata f. sp. avenae TaxID=200324 RepID=A0A2N5VXV2_9BASI|nr:hypothetical protein PCANC_03717 [Puccinia coronata f. sp. avenae]
MDQLDGKIDILRNLRTSMLPSIKRQLGALLESLAISKHPTYPFPDPEPTAVILSEMHGTIGKTVTSVETLAQDEPLPEPSHDHYLQDFKQFRLILTLWKKQAVIDKLGYLFEICWTWIIE